MRIEKQDSRFKIDDFVKSLKNPFCVIPVETGIQYYQVVMSSLDTRCSLSRFIGAGMTTFYSFLKPPPLVVVIK